MGQEKRRCLRLDIELPVSFDIRSSQRHQAITTTLNVSATGLSFLTREPLKVGQSLILVVGLGKGQRTRLPATVRWIKESFEIGGPEYLVGMQLDDKAEDEQKKFVLFVAQEMIRRANLS
ncbi:MAG TPA: PilZ domain-containing protein [Candidatus Omnitrophota bacterium]|nr:PilZ domain-containing protein [Candidatus Omnitrophota bacterium]